MRRHLLVLVLATGLTQACAPRVVWHGHDPTRATNLRVLQAGGRQWVEVNGQKHRAGGRIDIGEIAWSEDGEHLAYAIRRVGRWHVVLDGRRGPAWAEVGWLTFGSRGELAYVGTRGNRMHVVRGEAVGPGWEAVGPPRWSADGRRLAHLARSGENEHLVVDGVAGPPQPLIAAFAIAARGDRTVYFAERRDGWIAIADGNASAAHDALDAPVFSPDGRRLAYVQVDGERSRVWVDGVLEPPFDRIRSHTLSFDATGEHLAYVAIDGTGQRLVRDGRAGRSWQRIEHVERAAASPVIAYVGHDTAGVRHVVVDDEDVLVAADVGRVALCSSGADWAAAIVDHDGAAIVTRHGEHRYDRILSGTLVVRTGGRFGVMVVDERRRRVQIVDSAGAQPTDVDLDELAAAEIKRMLHGAGAEGWDAMLRKWVEAELDART